MRKITKFLQLIRIHNLILIILIQFFAQYYILIDFNFIISKDINFYLLVFITVLITASGYIINDIFDEKIDNINRKERVIIGQHISSRKAILWYYIFNILSIICSFILCVRVNKPYLLLLFLVVIYLLWRYSKRYKYSLYTGNILVSTLISLSIINVFIFSKSPEVSIEFSVILFYSCFAFLISLVREIIKDIEDIKGDSIYKSRNIAITYGKSKAKNICIILLLILISIIFYAQLQNYFYQYWNINIHTNIIYSILIVISIFYTIHWILKAKENDDFHKISQFIKIIMFSGIFSIPVFQYY